MEDDDILSPILGRRALLRGAGALSLLGFGLPKLRGAGGAASDLSDLIDPAGLASMCVVTPSETQGPYYLNLNLYRSDIREGYPGLETQLLIRVVHASDCSPVIGADIDVWHANAAGAYSGFASQGTQGLTFLRGVQTTNLHGNALFTTIYPGWYPGRTSHIEIKVRPTITTEMTSQLYFPQPLNRRVNAIAPYSAHGQNPTTNAMDALYLPETLVSFTGVNPVQLALTIGIA